MANYNVNHFLIEDDDNTYFVKDDITNNSLLFLSAEELNGEDPADYDDTAEYAFGDFVTYDDAIWACKDVASIMQQIPVTGNFDPTKWQKGFIAEVNVEPWKASGENDTEDYFIGTYNNYETLADLQQNIFIDITIKGFNISFFNIKRYTLLEDEVEKFTLMIKKEIDPEGMSVAFEGKIISDNYEDYYRVLKIGFDEIQLFETPEIGFSVTFDGEDFSADNEDYDKYLYLVKNGYLRTIKGNTHIAISGQPTQEVPFFGNLGWIDDKINYQIIIDMGVPTLFIIRVGKDDQTGANETTIEPYPLSAGE